MRIYSAFTAPVRTLCVGGLLSLGSACTPLEGTSSRSNANTQHTASAGDTPCTLARRTSHSELGEYHIDLCDQLTIWFRSHDDLGIATLPVHTNGRVSVPLHGDVVVAGLTKREASAAITQKLEMSNSDPVVICRITRGPGPYEGARARVTGAVVKASSIPYCEGMTVLDLVREAGGVTDVANLRRTVLWRNDGSRLQIRLDHILEGRDTATNYFINRGDNLTIPRN